MNVQETYQNWYQKVVRIPEFSEYFLDWYPQHQQKKIRYLQEYLSYWEHFVDKQILTVQEAQHFLNKTFSCALENAPTSSQHKTVVLPPEQQAFELSSKRSPSEIKQIGPYDILEKLGQGGMGVVYKVKHRFLNQIAVLKIILASAQQTPELLERFHRESQIMAKLKHPHIVQIYDSGKENGQHYFCMEYVDGVSLREKIGKDLSIRESIVFLAQILEALEYAHTQGVIHRDLKPDNIFVTRNNVAKIGDFGLARKQDLDSKTRRLTKSGEIFGSPAYMAPEQAMGETSQIDQRTDIYAVGACFYEMLTLRSPHEGASLTDLLMKVVLEEVLPPSTLNPDIHPDLDSIVLKALAKEKGDRYASAKEFAEDVNRFLEGYPILAKRANWKKKSQKWLLRNKKIGMIVLAILLVLLQFYEIHRGRKTQHFQSELRSILQKTESEQTQHTLIKTLEELKRLHSLSGVIVEELEAEEWRIGNEIIEIACRHTAYRFAELLTQDLHRLKTIPASWKMSLRAQIKEKREAQKIAHMKRLKEWISAFEEGRIKTAEQKNEAIFEVSKMKEEEVYQTLLSYLEASGPYFLSLDDGNEVPAKTKFYFFIVQVLGRMEEAKILPLLVKYFTSVGNVYSTTKKAHQNLKQLEYLLVLIRAIANLGTANRLDPKIKESLFQFRERMDFGSPFFIRSLSAYKKMGIAQSLKDPNSEQESSDTSLEFYLEQGKNKLAIKAWTEANEAYSQAIRRNPSCFEAYYGRGFARNAQNDLKGALKDFSEAVRLNPNHGDAYFQRGKIRFMQHDENGALLDYEQTILLDRNHSPAYLNRGMIKMLRNDISGAFQDYETSLQINPKNVNAYIFRARAKQFCRDLEGALLDYNEAIRIDPESPEAYLSRGELKFVQKKFTEAFQDFNEAIRLKPQNPSAYLSRGKAKQQQNDSAGAIEDFTQVILIFPNYEHPYFFRGLVYFHLKKTESALNDFKKVLELTQQNTSPEALNMTQTIFKFFPELKK